MKKILPIIILFLCNCSFGQQITYSNVFHDAQFNEDTEVKTVIKSFTNTPLLLAHIYYSQSILIELDTIGNQVWSKTYKTFNSNNDVLLLNTGIRTSDSNYVLAGKIKNATTSVQDAFCMKINRQGDTLWTKSFNLPTPSWLDVVSIIESTDSSCVIAGTIGQLTNYLFVIKLDSEGNLIWSTELSLPYSFDAKTIKQAINNTYYIQSQTNNSLIQISENGQFNWAKKYENQIGIDFEIQTDGILSLFLSGINYDLGLMKCDFSGNASWIKRYSLTELGYGFSNLLQLVDGSFIITDGNEYEGRLLKVDPFGNILRSNKFILDLRDAIEMDDKGLCIVGNGPIYEAKSLLPSMHFGIIKTDSLISDSDCHYEWPTTMYVDTLSTTTAITMVYSNEIISQENNVFISPANLSSFYGCVDYYGGINEYNSTQLIEVYPNSSSGIFNIEQLVENSALSISVYDAFGQEILKQQLTSTSSSIDLSEKATGIYFYRVVGSDLKSAIGKIIVSR